jgi:peptidoglycan/LPS O-acetylase OafA/YrhL
MSDSARRIPQLDGVRGTAISLVVIWHFVVVPIMREPHEGVIAHFIAHAGLLTWSGVDLFFVLSGFLIGGILIDAKESHDYFRTFYVRRAFRILPIYMLVVISYLLLWSVATEQRNVLQETLGFPMPWYVYLSFTQNFWLAHRAWDSVYLTVSWSLAVEEQFYLLLPAIIRILPRQSFFPAAATLALASASTRCLLYLHYGASWGTAAYTLIFSRADALMLGVICAVLLRDRGWKALLVRNLWAIKGCFVMFGLGIALLTYKGWGMGTMPMCTFGFTYLALFYALALMIAMISPEGWLSRTFRARWLMGLGSIAYGLYLFHAIVLTVIFRIVLHRPPAMVNWLDGVTSLSAFVVTLGLARLSWKYFESKLVRFGHRFTYGDRSSTPPSVPLSVVPSR